ncbi:hypothetical protein ABNX05_19630 [Lysinibacillus sp. M3]|uniref:GNAT family N-acetyltransferase n=1 Tax=Lysinibacillus zambalensis TaxID=3160866 RepID=A0ABV1MY44_9BACI
MIVRFFESNEQKSLQKAIDELWVNNHIYVRDVKLLNSMFYESPYKHFITQSNDYSFLGVWDNQKIVGLLGVIPFKFNQKGKISFGVCLTNWIVEESYRKTGAGMELLKFVQNLNPSIILSLGINDNVKKLYKALKWEVMDSLPRWVGIVNKQRVIEKVFKGNDSSLKNIDEIKIVENDSDMNHFIFNNTGLNSMQWNLFHESKLLSKYIGISREFNYIEWRYLKHPTFTYKYVLYKDNDGIKGLVIYRIESILKDSKIGRIVEILTDDKEVELKLIKHLINYEKSLLFWDFYCASTIASWSLENVGFKKSDNQSYFPTRFQPLDLSVSSIKSAIYINPGVLKKLNVFDINPWYITKGDSDQDRPN